MRSFYIVLFLVSGGAALGAPSKHISVEEVRQVRLPEVELDSVKQIAFDAKKPNAAAHVEVKGTIGGHIRFELLLPDSWNGRFVMGGGGGFVGTVQNVARDTVNKGYATIGTDTGHQSEGVQAGWALDNLEAKVNFGYLAVHRTAEVAKAMIRAYYGQDSERSYFLGCSRGGGQAMMEAQRFPKDFEGIVAGAPAFNWTGIAAAMVTIAKTLYPDPSQLSSNVLTKATLQKLSDAIIAQCDEQDGLKDGIIQDPAAAHFDLSKVEGLTDEQRKAIETIFHGARDIKGANYPGFFPVAECSTDQWIAWITGPVAPLLIKDHAPDLTFAFGTQIFKYLIFNQADWNYATYDFSNYEQDARLAASYLNATNPDLSGLKARKGRLIIWHGWADTALPAQGTIDYYREVLARDSQAADYCRLFMVPGCLHCGGGPGAAEVDWLAVIVDWVEKSKAPDHLIVSKHEGGKLALTRPLYPYPGVARFKGTGDPNKAESFELRK